MKQVKDICPHCNKAIEYKEWENILRYINTIITSFLLALGIIFIAYVYVAGFNTVIETAVQGRYNFENKKVDDELRFIAMDITKNCSTDKSECFIKEMYKNVSDIRYVPTSIYKDAYDPLYVYQYGGDCKNTANMFVAMLGSVGTIGKIKCSFDERHCISEFYDKHSNGKFVVDLTIPMVVFMNTTTDAWDYMDYKSLDWT